MRHTPTSMEVARAERPGIAREVVGLQKAPPGAQHVPGVGSRVLDGAVGRLTPRPCAASASGPQPSLAGLGGV